MPKEQRCETCRWWKWGWWYEYGQRGGNCHQPENGTEDIAPIKMANQRCSKWEPRDAE